MKKQEIKKGVLMLVAGILALFLCQAVYAWDWKKEGYKLDGKFTFPPLEDFGQDYLNYKALYPPEEQEKDIIKIYNSSNVDEIKDLLAPNMYEIAKNPREWNTDEWTIRLTKYKKIKLGGKLEEWTEKKRGGRPWMKPGRLKITTADISLFIPI